MPTPARLTTFVAALVAAASIAFAGQPQGSPGSIAGVVTGPDGALLPGASVIVAAGSGAAARVVTGDHGGFRVSALPPGEYQVVVELPGFRAVTRAIDVGPGRTAQVDVALDVATLTDSVTVVAERPTDSLEAPKIAESGARDVGEALGGMAGVWKVRRAAIASDVVVRGYQGENLTVLIDGVRLYGACPSNMDPAAFHVDFAEVDRIEVGKGPFDIKNQGALGGVVNIVTKRAAPGLEIVPQLSFGSAGFFNPSLTASFGGKRAAVLGGFSYRRSGDYHDGAGRSMLAGTNYRAAAFDMDVFSVRTGWGRVDLVPSEHDRLFVTMTAQRAGDVLYPYLMMDALWDNADRIKAGWDSSRALGRVQAVRSEVYATRVRHWMTDSHRASGTGARGFSMGTLARTASSGARVEAVAAGLTAGIEAFHREWLTESQLAANGFQPQYAIPDVNTNSVGVFGEYSRGLGRGVRLEAGGRLDRSVTSGDETLANLSLFRAYHGVSETSATDTYPSGKARVAWSVRPEVTISGGVGRTVRLPDAQERYYGLKRMGTDWVGNPALDPSSSTGLDLSLTLRPGRLYLSAALHREALHDYINVYDQRRTTMVPGIMNTLARSYRNVDATMTGAEIEAVLLVTDRLFVAGDLSAVRGRQVASPERNIPAANLSEIPPMRGRLAMRYDRRGARGGLFMEVEGVYSAAQERVATELRETPTAAYFVANTRMGVTVRRIRFTAGVGNLFDRVYTEHLSFQRDPFRSGVKVYEPGRNLYGNLSVTF